METTKKINKLQITRVTIYDEKLMTGYMYYPEVIRYIPFTKIKWYYSREQWSRRGRDSDWGVVTEADMGVTHFSKNGLLYKMPKILINMSGGWRDDVVKHFDTIDECLSWCEEHLSGVELITV